MKNLTVAIVLRILFFIIFSLLVMQNANYSPFPNAQKSPSLYITLFYWIVLGILFLQMRKHYKSQPNGRALTKDIVLPEFASKDEREMELTGKAAKDALSTILICSPFLLGLIGITMIFEGVLPLLLTFLLIAAIPIVGLITYYFSYRHHYLQ
jgi:uncharacterized integral membrane protein